MLYIVETLMLWVTCGSLNSFNSCWNHRRRRREVLKTLTKSPPHFILPIKNTHDFAFFFFFFFFVLWFLFFHSPHLFKYVFFILSISLTHCIHLNNIYLNYWWTLNIYNWSQTPVLRCKYYYIKSIVIYLW